MMRFLKITPFLFGHPIIIGFLIFKIDRILSSDGFGVVVAPIFVGVTLFMIFTLVVDRIISTRINIKLIVVTEVLLYIGLFIWIILDYLYG